MSWAAYVQDRWLFNVIADSEGEALSKARSREPRVDRVELVSKNKGFVR